MAEIPRSNGAQKRKRGSNKPRNEVISPSSIVELKNALYATCASLPGNETFDQNELLEMGTIPNRDVGLLQECTSLLIKEGLFKLMTRNGRVCWRVVKQANAAR